MGAWYAMSGFSHHFPGRISATFARCFHFKLADIKVHFVTPWFPSMQSNISGPDGGSEDGFFYGVFPAMHTQLDDEYIWYFVLALWN